MYIVFYFFANMLVMGLQVYNVISQDYAILIYLSTGIILLSLSLNRIKKLKQQAGEVLIQLDSHLETSKLTLLLELLVLALAISFLIFAFVNKVTKEWFLNYPVNFLIIYRVIYDLYLNIYARAFFTADGLFIGDKIVKWDDIESYGWETPHFSFVKGCSRLLIKKKTRFLLGEVHLQIKDYKRLEIEKLLQKKIGTSHAI